MSNFKPFLLGICGGSASGKTSVSHVIYKTLGVENCLLFSMDNYYFGPNDEERKHLSDYNFDRPEALDLDLVYKHLLSLQKNEPIDMPLYNFNGSYRMKETQKVFPNKIIIFEGIFAFVDKRIRDMMDLKIFVDLASDIRLSRRVYRDIKDRARVLDTILERFHKFVKPAYNSYIAPTKKYADIIIPKGAENTQAVDLICQYLKNNLKYDEKSIKIIKKPSFNIEIDSNEKEESNLIICKEKEDNIKLKKIFNNFINQERTRYYYLYLDILIKILIKLEKNYTEKNISSQINFIENTLYKEYKENTLFNKINNFQQIILFIPILLSINENLKNILIELNNKTEKNVIIIIESIYMSKKSYDEIKELNNNKFLFIVLYCGNQFLEREEFIKKGGIINTSDELNKNRTVLNKNEFEKKYYELKKEYIIKY